MKLMGLKTKTSILSLEDIFADEESSLLSQVVAKPIVSADATLIQNFQELSQFYAQYERLPVDDADFAEKKLARRLAGIMGNDAHVAALQPYDDYGLLEKAVDNGAGATDCIKTLADIFAEDDDLLALGDVSILQMKHISNTTSKPYADEEMGTRFECLDFWQFEGLFKKIHANIQNGQAHIGRLRTEQNLNVGDIFILHGLLCYIAEMIDTEDRKSERRNYRLRLIFENGLESNMLMRSLARAVYKDEHGRQVTLTDDESVNTGFVQQFTLDGPGLVTGQLYVLKLVTPKPELVEFKQLHKIGFTTSTVEARIAHSEQDIAFLESKVRPVATFTCQNMNPQALESLIHAFFNGQRLNIKLMGKNGQLYSPKEWFDVSLGLIQQVVGFIMDGTISEYRMDNTTGKLCRK